MLAESLGAVQACSKEHRVIHISLFVVTQSVPLLLFTFYLVNHTKYSLLLTLFEFTDVNTKY